MVHITQVKKIKSKVLLLLPLALALSGCSGMFTNEARCPFTDKGGCQSVTDVNKMVDEQKFTQNKDFVQQAAATKSAPVNVTTQPASIGGLNTPTPVSGDPLRSQEVDARMWIAPWQDKAGSYHGASYLTFVVEHSHWNDIAAKAITSHNFDDEG